MNASMIARMALITVATMLAVSVANRQFPAVRRLTKGG
jgi:hypothetical protein